MMAQSLHELLKEDQEPFHLKTYIADRLQVRKQNQAINLCKQACFFKSHKSPEVRRSPVMSSCKSPAGPVFLQVPSRTAAVLVEAAMRIQKRQRRKTGNGAGFGLFGSCLKILKDRNKKRVIEDSDFRQVNINVSCSCDGRRLRRGDMKASTSSFGSEEINGSCPVSPFRFSLHESPSSSGRRSPADSPSPRQKQDKVNLETRNPDNLQGSDQEEKEQCSPVSVLDPFFEEDGHESGGTEEEDCDLESSYANVQRVKQQLLYRLRRFEKLAELDPMELEKKLMEGNSDDEWHEEESLEGSRDDETSPLNSNVSTDVMVDEKSSKSTFLGNKEVVWGRICNGLKSWKEVEFDAIDTMVGLDVKGECDGWIKFPEEVEETAANVEVSILALLVEELSEELVYIDEEEEHNSVTTNFNMILVP